MRRAPLRLIGTGLAAVALLIALPASAQAAFTLSGLTAAPASTQAGAHSDFHIHMDFSGGQVKDLTVGLPPGMIGDPNATPLCTVDQLNGDTCPANTKVGAVTANATVTVAGPISVPVTVNGDLYNLVPQAGEPARFGIVLRPLSLPHPLPSVLPPIILQSAVHLRPDYGLDTVINDIPNSTSGLSTTIDSQDITLFGTAPGTGKHFMRNPTSCKQQTTDFTAVPYSGNTATGQASFTTTNCAALDFSPSFTAFAGGPGGTASGAPTAASTSIDQDLDEAGLLKAQVQVPNDFNPNAALFGGACSPADFQTSKCGPSAQVGLAVAASPLLSSPLVGPVELVDAGTGIPNIGLDLQGQLHLLLQGTVDVNKVVTFDGLPDIPIAHFQLAFANPPGLLGNTRDICAPPAPVFHADFTGYNGKTASVDAPATVDGCGPTTGGTGGKCKKAKKKRKHRAAEVAKKHKKRSCKKKHKRRK